ncbi:MAG: hypothetical protein HOY71_05645 [Nonomuraea sp.]|nr:hypothetical protein [Nonomuraea sp.]
MACGGLFVVVTQLGPAYTAFGYTVVPDGQQMFLAGAVAMALLVLGLWMMSSGSARSFRRRRQLRAARRHAPAPAPAPAPAQPPTDRLVAGRSDDTP